VTNSNVNARLTYLGASVESSLYRNGKVFTQRDREGNDGAYHGVVTEQRDVVINDARRLDQSRRRQIEVHWFELLQRTLQRPDLQFLDNRQVVQEYYPECAEIVRKATNAAQAFAFEDPFVKRVIARPNTASSDRRGILQDRVVAHRTAKIYAHIAIGTSSALFVS